MLVLVDVLVDVVVDVLHSGEFSSIITLYSPQLPSALHSIKVVPSQY